MNAIANHIKAIMLTAGVWTSTTIFATIAPEAALQSMFGESLQGPVAEIVVRSWGALVAMVGGLLIVGAYRRSVRALVLTAAALSKSVFVILIVSIGPQYLNGPTGVAAGLDAVFVLLFVAFLLGERLRAATSVDQAPGASR